MNEKDIIRSVIMEAIRIKGTQSVVASEAGMDGGGLSKAISGEGSAKLDALDKIFLMAGVRVITEQEYADNKAMVRILARMLLSECRT